MGCDFSIALYNESYYLAYYASPLASVLLLIAVTPYNNHSFH
jgi:hypothetical protein